MIRDGAFSPGEPDLFAPIVDALLAGGDRYMLLADYASYVACQERVGAARTATRRRGRGCRSSTSRGMGKFSSDRAIREYAEEIWGISPVSVAP